jgi:hypothetical protein
VSSERAFSKLPENAYFQCVFPKTNRVMAT